MEIHQLFRLCHVCNQLNEAEEEILRCEGCGKSFLPLFYFESRVKKQLSDIPENKRPEAVREVAVQGLIVLW